MTHFSQAVAIFIPHPLSFDNPNVWLFFLNKDVDTIRSICYYLSMNFKSYYATLNREQKKILAERLDSSPEYLRQIYKGQRFAGLKIIRAIEPATRGAVKFNEMPMKPLPPKLRVSF